jgi:stearoyl-CoA desaturase (Delta-9 desaturase)
MTPPTAVATPDAPTRPDDTLDVDTGTLGGERKKTWEQVALALFIAIPFLAVIAAVPAAWGGFLGWRDVILAVAFYTVAGHGISIGFHRYFTHKGFDARTPVKIGLAVLGCMTMQGPLTQWVTDHRKHHALSDREGDPHSPHIGHGEGVLGAVRGFVHAHVGWLFTLKGMERGRDYGRDLYEDRIVRTIDRMYMLWVVLTFGLPFALGYAIGGTWQAGLEGLVWGGLLRVFLYQHATFSVNSICHMFGRRDYPARDESRNNWLVAALVFGEGWHNNHHAFPASAKHGLHRFQIDVSWWVIRGMEKLGLVYNVRIPSASQLARKRIQPSAQVSTADAT